MTNDEKLLEKYKILENEKDYIKAINNADIDTILNFLNVNYPEWIRYNSEKYSQDYNYLQNNWKHICKKLNITPQKILLVEYISFDPTLKVLNCLNERLTKLGYCVRRDSEFILCKNCNAIIPCKNLWQFMKNNKLPVPNVWNNVCTKC